MPPRNVNVLQGGFVPGLQPRASSQQQQQQQNMAPSPSPGLFQQQRNQGTFPFNAGLGQQQQTTTQQQQQHQATTLQQHSNAPPQTNGASTGLPPHLTQNATTPSLGGTAPSASSTSEVGLDPNDFPALGSSAPSNAANSGNAGAAASYASQAGTGVPLGTGAAAVGGAGNGNGSQSRDFTPDDFPALGGQASAQNQDHSHPPGLNGFQHTEQSTQHRQNLLGSIQQPATPGMLNIGAQARNVHPGFQQQTQTEVEKQRVSYFSLYPTRPDWHTFFLWIC